MSRTCREPIYPMKIRIVLFVVCAAICVGSFFVGYRKGKRDEHQRDVQSSIRVLVDAYLPFEAKEFQLAEGRLRMSLWAATTIYDENYATEKVDDDFAIALKHARRISQETQKDWSAWSQRELKKILSKTNESTSPR